ncbi:DUF3304 domain-containing protein [Achromobacter sp. 2789STDY5608621]|uniref:DUF3304 domain-containing protein n=1 Tax=Achromobacter sp. 2789STDY5608621 TaxID=1806496 RepID=UPI0006C4EB10|nr:DUF3304 domain-containing protein [Achromobacter sp. 2789STDY5608621]CUJ57285.1 Protein of uncharacterised function (DUF3304) [Achromobacter sp. 2789STDY5608621]
MRKGLFVLMMWLGLLAGCNGEPSYQGLSFVAYNYTPWDLDRIQITDAHGGKAATGAIGAGGGEGSVTCCYSLKGTDFKVEWRGADGEKVREHMFDGKLDEVMFNKQTPVHFPATDVPPGEGPLYLELHIYPDEHMELALSRKLLGQVRLPIVEVTRWLYAQHRDALGDYRSSAEVRRVVARVTKTAWTRYRIEDGQDLQQYMFLYFTVASNFDADADIAALLAKPGRQPGDFAKAVRQLPADKIAHLKATGAKPGAKNG